MATMFFGQYLLAKGAINRAALLDALDRQRRSNLSLPDLAVQRGMINREQASGVAARFRMSERPIEAILIDSGFLDAEQVERLQRTQRSSWLRIGSALVEGGYLSDEQIARYLEEYRSQQSSADQQIREAMHGLPDREAVSTCVELTVFHFSRVTSRPAKLQSVSTAADELLDGRQRFSQRIVGDGDYTIAVDLGAELSAAVSTGMLGFEVEPGSEVEADAVCEFINLIGGNACTRLEQLGNLLRPEPPVLSGSGVLVSPLGHSVRARVVSADSDFDIRIFSRGGGG